jgi:hypothetical protein
VPQLAGSVKRSMQIEPHWKRPPQPAAQVPATQDWPAPQLRPQAPQLAGSERRSAQVEPQAVRAPKQATTWTGAMVALALAESPEPPAPGPQAISAKTAAGITLFMTFPRPGNLASAGPVEMRPPGGDPHRDSRVFSMSCPI